MCFTVTFLLWSILIKLKTIHLLKKVIDIILLIEKLGIENHAKQRGYIGGTFLKVECYNRVRIHTE